MKKYALIAVLAAAASPAFAEDGQYLSVAEVAEITGLHVREVQMMAAPAHSTSLLFHTSYNRVSRAWNKALEENDLQITFHRAANGELIAKVERQSEQQEG